MSRLRLLVAFAMTIVLAACGSQQPDSSQVAEVVVGSRLGGGGGSLDPAGAPSFPDGNPGVTQAILTIFRDGVQVYYDESGNEVQTGSDIVLTSTESSRTLKLVHGVYDFVVAGHDDANNELATGGVWNQSITEDTSILVPLVSLIADAELTGPVEVLPSQVFDVFLTVRPPARPDLVVPTSDFDAQYEYTGAESAEWSDLGIRVVAQCEAIDVSVDVFAAGAAGVGTVLAVDTLNIPLEATCPTTDGTINVDLVPPYVNITSHNESDEIVTGIGKIVRLEGFVNDVGTGLAGVEIYEGVVRVGHATLHDKEEGDPMGKWVLEGEYFADLHRPYDITVVATDNAGNESRATITLIAIPGD